MLITHAKVATLSEAPAIIDDGAILIRGARIADLGSTCWRNCPARS